MRRIWSTIKFYALTTRRERAYVRMVAKDIAQLPINLVTRDDAGNWKPATPDERAAFGEQLRQMSKGATS